MTTEATGTAVAPSPRKKRTIWIAILGVVVAIVAIFLIVVSLQPADFRLTRTTAVAAPPEAVFAHVNDFHKWQDWSPWAKKDPNAKNTYEGAPAGEGAVFAWDGNNEVGQGRMTITESQPGWLVRIRLEFIKPFAATNTAEFTFEPRDGQTAVAWSMYGQRNFIQKAFCLIIDMEKMVGPDFEKGLAQLKAAAERSPG